MQRRAKDAEQRYRALLERRAKSGLSLRAFAAKEGIPAGTLSYWQFELRRRDRERATEATPTFLPVKVIADPEEGEARSGAVYEIVLGKRSIRVWPGFDPAMVTALVRAVEASSC